MDISIVKLIAPMGKNNLKAGVTNQYIKKTTASDTFELSFKGEEHDFKKGLIKSLRLIKDDDKNNRLTPSSIAKIISSAQNNEQADIKLRLATMLSEIRDKFGEYKFSSSNIAQITTSAQTCEHADTKLKLASMLSVLKDKDRDYLFDNNTIADVTSNAQTKEQARLMFNAAVKLSKSSKNYNPFDLKEIISKINTPKDYEKAMQKLI